MAPATSTKAKRTPKAGARGGSSVLIAVGNTYQRIPEQKAKLNRKGTLRKVHDWVLYLDVLQGDSDWIHHVEFQLDGSFQPSTFICSSPVNVVLADGSRVLRFKTRQQSTGALVPTVKICGPGTTSMEVQHPISLKQGGKRGKAERFVIKAQGGNAVPKKRLAMADFPETRTFGVELELSCDQGSSREAIAQAIQGRGGVPVTIIQNYRDAHNPVSGWKLVHDGSLQCRRDVPNCSKFELVSPILRGEPGLRSCEKVLGALRTSPETSISVNHTMGFHVHISVEGMSLANLKKICQNFVEYEDAMDAFMPPSRRTGSQESNQYFKSSKASIRSEDGALATSNASRHRAIEACATTSALCKLMNPTGRYYKMNMQNLVTGRQPTIEFRQHSATANANKVTAWVRFCMALVDNSAQFKAPSFLKSSRGADEQFHYLFDYVIKDRALQRVFVERMAELAAVGERTPRRARGHCCDGCNSGGPCATAGRG